MNQLEERRQNGLIYKNEEPKKFDVIFLNDNVTTMDFVTYVLEKVFYKTKEEAFELMMKVHNEGKAVVGTYSYDIAMTKKNKVDKMAEENGFPLEVLVKETKE